MGESSGYAKAPPLPEAALAVTLSAISTEQYNRTRPAQMAQLIDGLNQAHPLLEQLGMGSEDWDGGDIITEPVSFEDHSDPTELTTGFEAVDTNVRDVGAQFLSYSLWFIYYPMAVSHIERGTNSGPNKVYDVMKTRDDNTMKQAYRRLDRHLTAGGQTAHSALFHFNGVDYPTTGYFEAALPTAQSGSVGGLAKATYIGRGPLLGQQYYDFGGSLNSNGFDGLAYIETQVRSKSQDTASDKPIYIASEGFYQAGLRLAGARVVEQSVKGAGEIAPAPKVMIHGVEVTLSPWMPTTGASTTATPISLYRINPKSQPLRFLKGMKWNVRGWQQHPTQPALYNYMIAGAQLCPKRLSDGALGVKGQAY